MIDSSPASFLARPGARQFVKFCLVGFSSFAIDLGLFNLLHFKLGWPLALSKAISFLIAVCNGFYWNRRWTFRHASQGDLKRQYPVFVLTNTVGLFLNLTIMTLSLIVAEKIGLVHTQRAPLEIVQLIVEGAGKREFNPLVVNAAIVVATVIVTGWNFTASRLWTFRHTPNR